MLTGTIISIQGTAWQVEVATNVWEISQGLSHRSSLDPYRGMLFDMGYGRSSIVVDMSRMLFSLDVAFLNKELVVVGVLRNVQPGVDQSLSAGARLFLEVNAGELANVEIGGQALVEGYVLPSDGMPAGTIISLAIPGMVGAGVVGIAAAMMKSRGPR